MINFTQELFDFDSHPIRDDIAMQANGGKPISLTLGRACSHALCAVFEDERNLSGEEKFERGMLAVEVRDNAAAELKAEKITLIKKVVAKLYGPIVVYRAYPLLDPTEK
jgi:hypothetical protein